MKMGALMVVSFISFSSEAFSEDLSFSEFARLKSILIEAGKALGKARACETANPGRDYGSRRYLKTFRDHMSKTTLSFEILEKLDAEILEAANREESSTAWISEYRGLLHISGCGDVCCVVAKDMEVYESRAYFYFKDYYKIND
jgi:hypothetical protein